MSEALVVPGWGWGSISYVMTTFNHVGFNVLGATTREV